MIREGFIYERICTIDNIKNAIMEASKEKRHEPFVEKVINNIDVYAKNLQELLVTKQFKPSRYIMEEIFDGLSGKYRVLFKPKFFPDQCVHWALMLQVEHLFMKGMYRYTCGSIKGRGTLYAKEYTERVIRTDYRNTKYCLKADIYHFYQSCNHKIVKKKVRRLIKDKDVLWLFDSIIDSVPDDVGLPLGNYTSQWLGNLMLTKLDHYIKEELGVPYYVRYADDIVLFGPNKKELHRIKDKIDMFLLEENLCLKDNWQVFRVEYFDKKTQSYKGRRVDFVGYSMGRETTRIRKRIARRMLINFKHLSEGDYSFEECAKFIAYNGWLQHSDSHKFYEKYVKGKIDIKRIKKVVSDHSKELTKHINESQDLLLFV